MTQARCSDCHFPSNSLITEAVVSRSESLTNSNESPHSSRLTATAEAVLTQFKEMTRNGSVDLTMETIARELVDKYIAEKRYDLLGRLHEKISCTESTVETVTKSAFALLSFYTCNDSLNYKNAEAVLMNLHRDIRSRTPDSPVIPKLLHHLAKLYAQQRARSKREILEKHRIICYVSEFQRPKLIPYSNLLASFVNLNLYKQLSDKANWISCELEECNTEIEEIASCEYYLGKIHSALKRFHEAEKCFTHALHVLNGTETPSKLQAKVQLCLGKVFEKTNRMSEAERMYAYESKPAFIAHSNMHIRLGDIFFVQHVYDRSETEYEKAISLLKSIAASPEDRAEATLRLASLYSRVQRYQELHTATTLAAACLDSQELTQRGRRLKLTLILLRRTIPKKTFYEIELRIHRTSQNSSQFCAHLISYAEGHPNGARISLLNAFNDKALFPRSSEARGLLAWCLAKHFIRSCSQDEAIKWFIRSFDIMLHVPEAVHYLPEILQDLTSVCQITHTHAAIKERINAAMKRFKHDPSARATLKTLTSADLLCESKFLIYENSVCLRAVYELRKQSVSDVEALNAAFESLKRAYEYMEAFKEEESLLLEHLAIQPKSFPLWLSLCNFYEEHKQDAKQEDAYRQAVEHLRRTEHNEEFLFIFLVDWGRLNLRRRYMCEAENCFAAAIHIVKEFTVEIDRSMSRTYRGSRKSALRLLMKFYTDRNRFSEAEAFFSEIIAKARTNQCERLLKAAVKLLGKAYMELHSYEEAALCLREFASLSLYNVKAIKQLIQVYMYLGKGDIPEMSDLRTFASSRWKETDRIVKLAPIHSRYGRLADTRKTLERGLILLSEPRCTAINEVKPPPSWTATLLAQIVNYCEHDPALLSLWLQLTSSVSQPPNLGDDCHDIKWNHGFEQILKGGHYFVMNPPALLEYNPKPGESWESLEQQWLKFVGAAQQASMAARAHWQLGRFYEKHSQDAQAEAAFQTAVQRFRRIHPTYVLTRKTTQKLARFYAKRNRIDEAKAVLNELFETLMRAHPGHKSTGEVALDLAELHRQQRQLLEAERLIKYDIETENQHSYRLRSPMVCEQLISLYREMGRSREAAKCCWGCFLWFRENRRSAGNHVDNALQLLAGMKEFYLSEVIILKTQERFLRVRTVYGN